ATQFWSEMAVNAIRQRGGQHGAVRGQPTLAAKIHDMRAQDQVLDDETRVAFEARARRRGDLDGLLLVDRQLRLRRPTLGTLRTARIRRRGRLLHPARLDPLPD